MKAIASLLFAVSTVMVTPSDLVLAADVWHHDFDAAETLAKENGATLVVHFHASWCGPCKVMERNVLSTAEVKGALGNGIVAVKVNSDLRKDLVRRFGIKTLPTDVFVSSDGKVLGLHAGYVGKLTYVSNLTRYRTHTVRKPVLNNATPSRSGHSDSSNGMLADSNDAATDRQVKSRVLVDVQPENLTKAVSLQDDKQIGLDGYSPVSLSAGAEWKKGDKEFRHEFQGVFYLLASREELNLFRAYPQKYVPVLHGFDPVVLRDRQKMEAGAIELGARFRDKLFFFATQTNRNRFLKNPREFANLAAARHLKNVVSVSMDF